MSAVAEAPPPAITPTAPPPAGGMDGFMDAVNETVSSENQPPVRQEQRQVEQKVPEPKPEPTEKPVSKNPRDRLAAIREPVVETPAAEPAEPAEPESPQKRAWGVLKEKANKWDEVEKELPELRKLKDQVGMSESDSKELARLRELVYARDFEEDPKYQDAVTKPLLAAQKTLGELAEYLELDPHDVNRVILEQNKWKRNQEIQKLITRKGTENEREVDQGTLNDFYDATNQLHTLWQEQNKWKTEAGERHAALKGKQAQEAQMAKATAEKAYQSAAAEVAAGFQEHWLGKQFWNDPEVQEAKPADNDGDRAFQAYAGAMLPKVMVKLAELIEFQKQTLAKEAARNGARPKVGTHTDTQSKEPVSTKDWERGFLGAVDSYTRGG